MAVLQTLNADLLSHDSATLTLERWCAAHGLAAQAKVKAIRVKGADRQAPDDVRQQLKVTTNDPLAY